MPEIIDALQELSDRGVDLNTQLEMTDKRSVAAFSALVKGPGMSVSCTMPSATPTAPWTRCTTP